MENLVKHGNVTTDELWRAWEDKGRRHDKAVARRMQYLGIVVIFVLAVVFVLRAVMK